MSDAYLGEIRMFGGTFSPRSWAFCHGQTIAISQNSGLFAIIGDIYGGDGRISLGIPNLQGRAPIHVGGGKNSGPGLSSYLLGERTGWPLANVSILEMPSHKHTVNPAVPSPFSQQEQSPQGNYRGRRPQLYAPGPPSQEAQMSESILQGTGGAGLGELALHNNRQPSMAIHYIICIDGLFPPRN